VLCWAVQCLGLRPETIPCLIDAGADIKALDNHGRTVLHYAVQSRYPPDIVSCLIDAGADINALDNHGRTVLHWAVQSHYPPEIVSCLIDAGADAEALDKHGRTVLHLAVEMNSRPEVVSCLIDAGADIEALDSDGRTVLQIAAVQRDTHSKIISCLIDAGADVEVSDKHGRTALHLAVSNLGKSQHTVKIGVRRANAVQNMLNAGADPNAQDKDGNTSLHLAIGNDLWDPWKSSEPELFHLRNIDELIIVVHDLILYSANLTTKNNDGVTAADLINGLPDRVSKEFRFVIAKAVQRLQGANHVLDTDMSGWYDIIRRRLLNSSYEVR